MKVKLFRVIKVNFAPNFSMKNGMLLEEIFFIR